MDGDIGFRESSVSQPPPKPPPPTTPRAYRKFTVLSGWQDSGLVQNIQTYCTKKIETLGKEKPVLLESLQGRLSAPVGPARASVSAGITEDIVKAFTTTQDGSTPAKLEQDDALAFEAEVSALLPPDDHPALHEALGELFTDLMTCNQNQADISEKLKKNEISPDQAVRQFKALSEKSRLQRQGVVKLLDDYTSQLVETGKVTDGAKTLIGMFKGLENALFSESADNSHECFQGFQDELNAQTTRFQHAPQSQSKGERLELFKEAVYMKEHVVQLRETEMTSAFGTLGKGERKKITKQLDAALKSQKVFTGVKRTLQEFYEALFHRKKQKALAIHHKYETLQKAVDTYFANLKFTDDELASDDFRQISIEAHLPRRKDLLTNPDQIREGALKRAEGEVLRAKVRRRQEFMKSYMKSYVGSKALGGLDSIDLASKKINPLELQALIKEPSARNIKKLQEQLELPEWNKAIEIYLEFTLLDESKTRQELTEALSGSQLEEIEKFEAQADEALARFQKTAQDTQKAAYDHPDLGNSKGDELHAGLRELIPIEKAQWQEAQEKAKAAIQSEVVAPIVDAYVELTQSLSGTQMPTTPKEIAEVYKQAGKDLSQARDDYLNNRELWAKPIDRTIKTEVGSEESGVLSSLQGKKMETRVYMKGANQGYTSGSFRGRDKDKGRIQSNFMEMRITHKVDGKPVEGSQDPLLKVSHELDTHATTCEFFLDGENNRSEARQAATEQQTLEVLTHKAVKKWEDLPPEERAEGSPGTSVTNPLMVETTFVGLLTPDAIRSWLFDNKELRELLPKVSHESLDPSKNERRMMNEALAAFRKWSYENRNVDESMALRKPFTFQDVEGNERTIIFHVQKTSEPGKPSQNYLVFEMQLKKAGSEDVQQVFVRFDNAYYNVGCNNIAKMVVDSGDEGRTKSHYRTLLSAAKHGLKSSFIRRKAASRTHAKEEDLEKIPAALEKASPLPKKNTCLQLQHHINASAFSKHEARYQRKMEVVEARCEDLRQKIGASQDPTPDQEEVADIERRKRELSQLREELLEVESEGKSTHKAFANWQTKRNELAALLDGLSQKEDLSPDLKAYVETVRYQEDLRDIFDEVSDQIKFQHYYDKQYIEQNMYSFPSSLVALSMQLNERPGTGCRSAKDRTGLQRTEIATKWLMKERMGRFPNFREMEKREDTFRMREAVTLNGGQIDDVPLKNGPVGQNLGGKAGETQKKYTRSGKIVVNAYQNALEQGVKNLFTFTLPSALPNVYKLMSEKDRKLLEGLGVKFDPKTGYIQEGNFYQAKVKKTGDTHEILIRPTHKNALITITASKEGCKVHYENFHLKKIMENPTIGALQGLRKQDQFEVLRTCDEDKLKDLEQGASGSLKMMIQTEKRRRKKG